MIQLAFLFMALVADSSGEAAIDAIRRALELPDAEIELVDWSKEPPDNGSWILDRRQLRVPALVKPSTVLLWRGYSGAGAQRTARFAKFRVTVKHAAVYALVDIPANRKLTDADLAVEERLVSPFASVAGTRAAASGKTARRPIPAGSAIECAWLTAGTTVAPGDVVDVEVQSKAARLIFRAVAQSGGQTGDFVTVKNPSNARPFRARVQGGGHVFVSVE